MCSGFLITDDSIKVKGEEPIEVSAGHVKHISGCDCNLCINCAKSLREKYALIRIKKSVQLSEKEIVVLEEGENTFEFPYIYSIGYEYHKCSCSCE